MPAQSRKAALETAANRIEFPFSVVSVQFPNDNRRFNRKIFAKVITDQFRIGSLIHNTDIGIGNLPEILSSGIGIINRNRKGNLFNICRDFRQVI